ncbi:MAG: SGNH/GDSL hydrolase family protein [Solirubrobacterales bacterium]
MAKTRNRGVHAPARSLLTLACVAGLVLGFAATASAEPVKVKVKVGKVRLGAPVDGRAALLVPVSYPIQMAGHRVDVKVSLLGHGGERLRTWNLGPRVSGGRQRAPEPRRRFTFIHSTDLSVRLTRLVEGTTAWSVRVDARAALDADRDGRPELSSRDVASRDPSAGAAEPPHCASIPQARIHPGERLGVDLPPCVDPMRWLILGRPEHGKARIRDGRLIYRPGAKFRGSDSVQLMGDVHPGAGSSGKWNLIPRTLEVKVGTGSGVVVRALGDSVTAGFGYYDDGSPMGITSLLSCEPGEKFFNDACSSNSTSRSNKGKKVEYASDYGLANNVSWAAQWANEHGVTNYENLAVSGSEPSDWLPGGQLYETAKRIESENPDYILMTVGANPLLSEMLFGVENMGCAIKSQITGGYRECVEEAFEKVHLRASLKKLYGELVAKTDATIFLMQYHLSIPSSALAYSATQIAEMGVLLNETIKSVAGEVSPKRLQVVTPPHFNVGIDIEPVFPSTYTCSYFEYKVDGQSVQSTPTQYELAVTHPLSFCDGPAEGPPWVISGDTGIHPSAAGYAQMAARVPAPE